MTSRPTENPRSPRLSQFLSCSFVLTSIFFVAALAAGQAANGSPVLPPGTSAPAQAPPQNQNPAPAPNSVPAQPQGPLQNPAPAPASPSAPPARPPALTTPPIAIVPLDMSLPGSAATVSGGMQAWKGRAYFTSSGAITAGPATAQVTLPYRGVLRVCPSTTVRLSVDAGAPANEVPGLMIAFDGGAVEASFAISRNTDLLLTPNFRIMIAGPGASEVKVRLGQDGDTCVDNSGENSGNAAAAATDAPYVVVTSVFDSGLYRVQPGQRVMFEHGDLHTVDDQEKEPCGCPPSGEKVNEFPLAQSEGLAPNLPQPAPETSQPPGSGNAATTLVYSAPGNQSPQPAAIPQPAPTAPAAAPAPAAPVAKPQNAQPKPGFFKRIGRFFKRVFGAE